MKLSAGLTLSFLCVALACASKPDKSIDQRDRLIGQKEDFIYRCAGIPTEKRKKNGYQVATIQHVQSQTNFDRLISSAEPAVLCEAKLKIVNKKVERIALLPKGSTVSARHPACYALFEKCLAGDQEASGKSWGGWFGSTFMKSLVEVLDGESQRLNTIPDRTRAQ